GPAVPGRPVDGAGASGPTVVGCSVGRVTAGSGDGGVVGGGVGEVLLTGGGARGTVGEAGRSGAVCWRGSAMRSAAPQARPAPAAARTSRRRAAARRI